VLADGRADHADASLLGAWIETPTWEESRRFLREHKDDLTGPRIRQLLDANHDDETVRQHLAILDLTATLPAGEVYEIVTDPATAREHALDLIEQGNLAQLALVLATAPATATDGITGAFIQTIMALANSDHDTARGYAGLIAEHGTSSQHEAIAIRLRAFAAHQPDPSPALEIAGIIAPADGGT
jgi:hypothetical protein